MFHSLLFSPILNFVFFTLLIVYFAVQKLLSLIRFHLLSFVFISLYLLKCIFSKETISKVKRQPSEWEKIIANKATDKELISKIYKQLLQLNSTIPGSALQALK